MSTHEPRRVEKTASQILVEECEARMRADAFRYDPDHLIETVARHYASLANTAMALHTIMKQRQFTPLSENARECAASLMGEIEKHHRADFGCPPSWALLRDALQGKLPQPENP